MALDHAPAVLAVSLRALPERFCRVCGCTDDAACEGGCYWVEPDLCSACVARVPVVLELAKRDEVTHG